MGRCARRSLSGLLAAVTTVLALFPAGPVAAARETRGAWVSVRPVLGSSRHAVREYLTAQERDVIRRIAADIRGLPAAPGGAVSRGTWHVEPAAASSPVLALQRKVLGEMESIAASAGGLPGGVDVTYVAARTQQYLRDTLAGLGCTPSLERTGGLVLLGASVCGRRIAVDNITGYVHLVSAGQRIDASLEARPEPPLRRLPHRLVVRAAGGMAHEFVHSWRAAPLGGAPRADEPAWFAEGLAEFWAGVAAVRAIGPRHTYAAQHVLRARDFADWAGACPGTLAQYRTPSSLGAGCEYHLGLLAVELLHARHGGLAASGAALARAGSHATFADWFAASYGVTVGEFEAEADAYIAGIRRAESSR